MLLACCVIVVSICRVGGGAVVGRGGEVYFGFSAAVNMRGDREIKRFMGENIVCSKSPAWVSLRVSPEPELSLKYESSLF